MPTSIGAKVELAGEKEFRKALADINTGLKLTASELTLVTAKYSENANSVTALTQKNTVLQNQITEQTSKVAKLREALAASASKYGETDSKTLSWQRSLNLADAELAKMQTELKKNSEQLTQAQKDMKKYGLAADEVADKTKGFGNNVADLASTLGVRLPAGTDSAIRSLDGTKVSTLALVGVVAGLITGLSKATIETAKYADEVVRLSQVSGLSTDTIQEMNYSAELVEVSAETITGAMARMVRSMESASGGTKETSEAFRKLHLSVTNNGQLKDSEQMFYDVIDALGKLKNETERDAVSMQIFGKSARELNPLIEIGSKALKEYGEQAKAVGYVMDEGTLQSFTKLDDAMQLFNNQSKTFKNSMAAVMLPILTSLFETLNKIDPKILATVAIIAGVAVVAVTVTKAIGDVTSTFKAMDPAMLKTTGIIVGVTVALIALSAIIAVILGKSSELNSTMSGIGNSVGNLTNTVNSAGSRVRYSYASGIDYVPSDRVAVIHRGERVQRADENPYNPEATRAGGGDTFILQVNMSEVDEVYKLMNVVKQARQKRRAGFVGV